MTDFFIEDLSLLALLIKFMVVSTVLMGGVFVAERTGLIKTPKMSETAWIAAIIASFIALLPFPAAFEAIELPAIEGALTNSVPARETSTTPVEASLGTQDNAQPAPSPNPPIARLPQEQDSLGGMERDGIAQTSGQQLENNPTPLSQIIVTAWLVLGIIALLTLVMSYRRAVNDLGSRIRVPAEHPANQRLRALCEQADIRHVPYLSQSSDINSPVCLPKREICLPDWAFEDMPEDALNSLIAHELAHMLRRDPVNMIVMQFIARIFFFQPLFALARRRLEDAAELAADEWAANTTANAGAVANALYTCAKKITEKRQIQWGLAMAGDQSILKQRIARLLKAKQSAFDTTGKAAPMVVAASILLAACAAPGVEFATSEYLANGDTDGGDNIKVRIEHGDIEVGSHATSNTHIVSDDDGFETGNMHWSDGDKSIRVSWEGPFTLTEDEKSIANVSRDGLLKISGTQNGDLHRIRFENDEGTVEKRYWVNNNRTEFDEEGEAWLATTLNHLMRHTAIDMKNRVGRYLKQGGASYALKRGSDLASDYAKRVFITNLVAQTSLNDSEKSSLIDIISTVESDYELRLLVTHLYATGQFGDEDIAAILDIADSIESDYEMRLALAPMINQSTLSDASLKKVLKLAQTMDSDYELRLLLSMAADDNAFSQENKILFVNAMSTIESDYEKRLLIDVFADKMAGNTAITAELLEQLNKMSSDYEKRLGLNTVLANSTMNDKSWGLALKAARSIDSDYEKALVLTHMADLFEGDEGFLADLRKAAETIDGDYERDNVLRAIGN